MILPDLIRVFVNELCVFSTIARGPKFKPILWPKNTRFFQKFLEFFQITLLILCNFFLWFNNLFTFSCRIHNLLTFYFRITFKSYLKLVIEQVRLARLGPLYEQHSFTSCICPGCQTIVFWNNCWRVTSCIGSWKWRWWY